MNDTNKMINRIVSVNIRGLANDIKRIKFTEEIEDSKAQIWIVLETNSEIGKLKPQNFNRFGSSNNNCLIFVRDHLVVQEIVVDDCLIILDI